MLRITVPGRAVERLHRWRYAIAIAACAAAAGFGVLLAYSPAQTGAQLIPPACATTNPVAYPCPVTP